MPDVFEINLKDSLSEVTRKERRSLLGISALGIVMVKGRLIPTKISALGIDFSPTNQKVLLQAIGFVVLYFVIAFVIYAFADFLPWYNKVKAGETPRVPRAQTQDIIERNLRLSMGKNILERTHVRIKWIVFRSWVHIREMDVTMLRPVTWLRIIFDFVLPLVLGAYSFFELLTF